jgi:hypothetical protein
MKLEKSKQKNTTNSIIEKKIELQNWYADFKASRTLTKNKLKQDSRYYRWQMELFAPRAAVNTSNIMALILRRSKLYFC